MFGWFRAEIFSQPVDPILLQIPDYYDVIGGKERARDLGTIKSNLQVDRYHNLEEFEMDVRQMLSNCFVYNPKATPVEMIGRDVEKAFEIGIGKLKKEAGLVVGGGGGGSVNKRKVNESGGSSKKTKLR